MSSWGVFTLIPKCCQRKKPLWWQGTSLWVLQNITKNHFIDFFFICFYLRALGYPVTGSWPSRKCRAWNPSWDGPEVKHWLALSTWSVLPLPQHMWQAGRLHVTVVWLGWYPVFSFCSLRGAFSCQRLESRVNVPSLHLLNLSTVNQLSRSCCRQCAHTHTLTNTPHISIYN
jgi:hypothetical protein